MSDLVIAKDDAAPSASLCPGLLYHVIARGNDGQKIFLRESDYQAVIEVLRTVPERYPFSLNVYVLMSNHVHLLEGRAC